MRKIFLLLLVVPLFAFQCESDEVEQPQTECDCQVKTYVEILGTDVYYFTGQQFTYDSVDCDNHGLIYNQYTEEYNGLTYFVQEIVECE